VPQYLFVTLHLVNLSYSWNQNLKSHLLLNWIIPSHAVAIIAVVVVIVHSKMASVALLLLPVVLLVLFAFHRLLMDNKDVVNEVPMKHHHALALPMVVLAHVLRHIQL